MYIKENIEDLYYILTTEGLVKRDFKVPFKEAGIRIENIIPPYFEGYAKIMIPWSMNSDAPNKFFKEIPLDEIDTDEIDEYFVQLFISNKPQYEILKKEFEHKWEKYFKEKQDYLNSIHTEKNKNWHFVSWKEVCAIYECHYHNEVSPFSFDYKFKGKKYGLLFNEYSPMAIGIASPLFKILQKHTKSNLLFINHKGAIEEVSKQQYTDSKNDFFLFNSVTKKREWMTYIGHESICITIGGNYDLIDELLNCKELEVLECTPLIRVDWHSDKINT